MTEEENNSEYFGGFETRNLEVLIDRAIFGNRVVWRMKNLPDDYENKMLKEGYQDINELVGVIEGLSREGKIKEDRFDIGAYIYETDHEVPPYARNMSYAWAVVNKAQDYCAHLEDELHKWCLYFGDVRVCGESPSASVAICLAAKEFIELAIKKNKENKDDNIKSDSDKGSAKEGECENIEAA